MTARYTLVIGNKNVSSWSLRAWLPMKVAGLPFEEIGVRLYQPETQDQILEHSASGRVPLLKIEDDGRMLRVWDSLAICETLAERHPEARLWPQEADARAQARSMSAEMHSGFPDLRRQLSMNIAARHETPVLEKITQRQVARVADLWMEALARHREGGFLYGHFTIADAFYAPVVTRFATYSVPLPAPAAAYCERIRALPAMREWIAAAKAEVAAASG